MYKLDYYDVYVRTSANIGGGHSECGKFFQINNAAEFISTNLRKVHMCYELQEIVRDIQKRIKGTCKEYHSRYDHDGFSVEVDVEYVTLLIADSPPQGAKMGELHI